MSSTPTARFVRRVLAMSRKETAHIRRDPGMLYLAIGMPLLLILIFGFGVRFDADDLPVVLVDLDRSATSRQLAEDLFASGEMVRAGDVDDVPTAQYWLHANRAVAAVVLPAGLDARLSRGERAEVQLLVDGTDGTIANMLLANAESISMATAAALDHRPPAYAVAVQTRYNPGGESAMFLLPGTIGYVLALVSVLLTGLAVAREWERGSMEQLFCTSVGIPEIVIGKLLPYVGLGTLDVLLSLALGAAVFDLPMRGPMWLVGLGSMLFIFGMLGQGLLISIVTRSQMLATQVAAISAMLPSMLLSGFLFPVENLPWPMRMLSHVVPGRFLIDLLRTVLLKGGGVAEVWEDLAALTVFAILTVTVSSLVFQRRIA